MKRIVVAVLWGGCETTEYNWIQLNTTRYNWLQLYNLAYGKMKLALQLVTTSYSQ
jgi:hypothetical protein